MATIINDSEFAEKVEKASGLVLVDFFATWCGPCKMMSPLLDKLSTELTGKAQVYKVDVDQSRQAASKFRIMSIPTLMWFKDGKVVESALGAIPYEALLAKTNSHL